MYGSMEIFTCEWTPAPRVFVLFLIMERVRRRMRIDILDHPYFIRHTIHLHSILNINIYIRVVNCQKRHDRSCSPSLVG